MKKTLTFIIISLMAFCAYAQTQDLYIGSFYVTSSTEESLYGDGNDKWTKRMPIICDMFNFEQPDVLGLQSLTTSQRAQIVNRLTNHKAAGDILYNKALQLDTCGVVEEMPEGSTCCWAKLQKGEKAFYVFNFCFSTDADIAATSATRVRSAAGEINTENLPCFVVGYLGVNETKTAYTRLTARFYDCYTKASIVSAEYGTVNNFDLKSNHGNNRYDFVFASKTKNTVKAYGQLQYGYFTQESDGSYKRRLPSTHFPVMAKVTLQ